MDRAFLLTGKVNTEQGSQESYQLLIDCNHVSVIYDGSSERILFYKEVSETFVKRILQEHSPFLEVGIVNGIWINPETGNNELLPKLEEILVDQFSEIICDRLKKCPVKTFPASSRN